MSNFLTVGIVCEGPTDKILIDGLLKAFFGTDAIVSTPLQPPLASVLLAPGPLPSDRGGDFGPLGGGWTGVLRWCGETALGGGSPTAQAAFANNDLIVIHLDADVAREAFLAAETLAHPCPPAADACEALRSYLTTLLSGPPLPSNLVFCIPADSTEAWVIASLAPNVADTHQPWECYPKPEGLLPNVKVRRFTVGKNQTSYTRHLEDFIDGWSNVLTRCTEAMRFDTELRAALP